MFGIDISNEQGKLNCISRLTTAIVNLNEEEKKVNTELVESLLSS